MRHYYSKTYPEMLDGEFGGRGIPGAEEFYCSGQFLGMLENLPYEARDLQLTARMSWAYTQWLRSSRPIIRLDRELVDLLLQTDLPDELEELPPIPWDGFWVEVSGFDLLDDETGIHEAEGVFVCKDFMRLKEDVATRDGFLLLAVGEDKRRSKDNGFFRDDTVHYVGIVANHPLRDYHRGVGDVCRIVVNLLLLWSAQNSPLQVKKNTPIPPKSPKKLKRLARQGKSLEKYWQVTVDPAFQGHEKAEKPENWEGPTHLTTVRGHYRCYWVSDTEGAAALGTKTSSTGKTLSKVRRFIAPHRAWRQGEAPSRNVYAAR
jgi:hypothetical protein